MNYEEKECPICGKMCKNQTGLSSHIFKQYNNKHIGFVKKQKNIIESYFDTNISPEELSNKDNIFVAPYYIRKIWKQNPLYEERKSKNNSESLKKQYKDGSRTVPKGFTKAGYKYNFDNKDSISKKQYDLIISLFDSNFSQREIAKKAKVNEKTIITTFKRKFSKEQINKRNKRMELLRQKKIGGHNKLENKDPKRVKKIEQTFYSDDGLHTLSANFKTGTGTIKRIWFKKFGKKEYEKRVAKMLRLQQKRAAKSLKKARFLGSKNEILCYQLLKKALPKENIVHHDYSVVPRLEIDICLPDRKVAICWDGLCHRKPIYGGKSFSRTIKHDNIRLKWFKNNNWNHIIIEDNGRHDPKFVEERVSEILEVI